MLSSAGSGSFGAESHAGVTVEVNAAREGALATRACVGTFSWNKNAIATMVPRLDLDAFDADLGIGVPVAAFEVKPSESDCCSQYGIYSLTATPKVAPHPYRWRFFPGRGYRSRRPRRDLDE